MPGRLFDTDCGCRSPAEAFKAKRASAGKKFKHSRPVDPVAEAVEYRLLNQVRRGANLQPLGHFQNSPRSFSTSDSHIPSEFQTGSRVAADDEKADSCEKTEQHRLLAGVLPD